MINFNHLAAVEALRFSLFFVGSLIALGCVLVVLMTGLVTISIEALKLLGV